MTKLSDLNVNNRNPNRMSKEGHERLRKMLVEYGDLSGIVYNRRTGTLIGGHQRQAVLDGGVIHSDPVGETDGTVARGYVDYNGQRYTYREVDWDENKANAAMIAANRAGRMGSDDQDVLAELLHDLTDTESDLLGYTDEEILSLIGGGEPEEDVDAEPQIDKIEELREQWGVESGQLWQLGDHRILCGDSTNAEDVARVLAGDKPLLMVADPPYGVEYDAIWRVDALQGGKANGTATGKVTNDDRSDWREAWALFPGDVAYVWHADVASPVVADSLSACGFERRALIVWAKNQLVIGRGDYHHQHEPCWYCVRKGKPGLRTDDRKQTTLWQIDKPHKSETGHSTQKPVECMARPIRNHDSEFVYEPFSGSGTTIIACEQLGRKCRAIEISPGYVAVTLQRYLDAAGKTPERL
jgi:DNA modification methylase